MNDILECVGEVVDAAKELVCTVVEFLASLVKVVVVTTEKVINWVDERKKKRKKSEKKSKFCDHFC